MSAPTVDHFFNPSSKDFWEPGYGCFNKFLTSERLQTLNKINHLYGIYLILINKNDGMQQIFKMVHKL